MIKRFLVLIFGLNATINAMAHNDDELKRMIGRLLVVGFRGFTIQPGSTIFRDLVERHIGGIILFDYDLVLQKPERNIKDPAQVKALTSQARALSPNLLISVDCEGGLVCRLKPKFGYPPTQTPLKMAGLTDGEFHKAVLGIASTLADAGFNVNFAPSVDLYLNEEGPIGKYERSFSSDPEVVTHLAARFIEAHREKKVATAIKHFPGHGSSVADSHLGFVDVTNTWSKEELEPFANLIQLGSVDSVMTAHVFHSGFDATYPATLSKKIITGILRESLSYDGLVFSDDMQMHAISKNYGFSTALELALNAGVDVLIFGNNVEFDEDIGEKAITTIFNLVKSGKVSIERIRQSFDRVEKFALSALPK